VVFESLRKCRHRLRVNVVLIDVLAGVGSRNARNKADVRAVFHEPS
jgi:hypothetical protein